MSRLKLALGGTATLALAATFALGRSPSPPAVAATTKFESRWDSLTPLKKQDRLPLLETSTPPSEVRARAIDLTNPEPEMVVRGVAAAPAGVPPVALLPDEDKPAVGRGRHVSAPSDERSKSVCRRHHLRTVYVRGGRSWRCRR